MIVLSGLHRRTETVKLGDLYGLAPEAVSVTLRSLTSIELGVARAQAMAALREAEKGVAALDVYGLAGEDAAGARLDLKDALQMSGAGELVGSVEVLLLAAVSWAGFKTADGQVAPLERATLAALLQDDAAHRRLMAKAHELGRVLVVEGKG